MVCARSSVPVSQRTSSIPPGMLFSVCLRQRFSAAEGFAGDFQPPALPPLKNGIYCSETGIIDPQHGSSLTEFCAPLLPALSSLPAFPAPSFPREGSKLTASRCAPGVAVVCGRSSSQLGICAAPAEDAAGWKLFVCEVCTGISMLCF